MPDFVYFLYIHLYSILLGIGIAIVLANTIHICAQYEEAVIFRLGKFNRIATPGIYFMIPFVERQVKQDLRVQTKAGVKQDGITSDNVPIGVDAVIWYKIIDAKKSVVVVNDFNNAVLQVCLTTLRTFLGKHSLDDILRDQDKMSLAMKTEIDTVTEDWGIAVTRVQMKDVKIPESMQRAMAQEAEALREKRARIIKAEAEFEAAQKLADAAEVIAKNPVSLELRRFQMMTEIGAEQNTSTIILIPSEFVSMAKHVGDLATLAAPKPPKPTPETTDGTKAPPVSPVAPRAAKS